MRIAELAGVAIISVGVGLAAGYAVWGGAEAPTPSPDPGSASEPESPVGPEASRADSGPQAPPTAIPESVPAPAHASRDEKPAACPDCPVCPPPIPEGASRDAYTQALREDNARLRARLDDAQERLRKTGPQRRYLEPTIQGRRRLAAEESNLLLEIPSWKDDIALRNELRNLSNLGPQESAELEALYQEFHRTLYGELRDLFVDMTGDPAAGENATINSMIHDLVELSPQDACRERMALIIGTLAAGGALPTAGEDAPICEVLILSLYAAVDRLDREIRGTMGDDAAEAFWSNTSSFEFGPLYGEDGGGVIP